MPGERGQQSLKVEIDTDALRPGPYLLALSRIDGATADVPFHILAPLPKLDRKQILAATAHDKKNTGTSRVMVFPKTIGECVVVNDVKEKEVAFGIDAIL